MNTDIRLSVEFWDHPKTLKLQRRLGLEAVVCLQRLWMWAAKNRPEGSLTGMDAEDIELAARWPGDVGVFTSALVDLRWLDQDDASCRIHDWAEHNAWAAAADDRSDHGRLCRMKKTHPSLYKMVTSAGITSGITREQYQELTTSKDPLRTLQGWLKGPLKGDSRVGQAQSPAPAPSPAPKEEDSEGKDPSSSSCAEPEAASAPQPANDSRLICTLPLNDGTDFEVLQGTVDQLRPLYPAVDVVESLKAMKGWLLGDSMRRKTRRGIMRFVTNWLEKDQNRGGGRGRPRDGPPGDIQPRTYAQMQDAERRMMARKALEVIRQEKEKNGQYADDQGAAHQAQFRLPAAQGG